MNTLQQLNIDVLPPEKYCSKVIRVPLDDDYVYFMWVYGVCGDFLQEIEHQIFFDEQHLKDYLLVNYSLVIDDF